MGIFRKEDCKHACIQQEHVALARKELNIPPRIIAVQGFEAAYVGAADELPAADNVLNVDVLAVRFVFPFLYRLGVILLHQGKNLVAVDRVFANLQPLQILGLKKLKACFHPRAQVFIQCAVCQPVDYHSRSSFANTEKMTVIKPAPGSGLPMLPSWNQLALPSLDCISFVFSNPSAAAW